MIPNPLQLKIVDFSLRGIHRPTMAGSLSAPSPPASPSPWPVKAVKWQTPSHGACCLSRNLTRKWKSIKTTTRKIRCGKKANKKCCKNYQRKFVEATRATSTLIRQSSRDRKKKSTSKPKRTQSESAAPSPSLALLRANETCKWTLGAVD